MPADRPDAQGRFPRQPRSAGGLDSVFEAFHLTANARARVATELSRPIASRKAAFSQRVPIPRHGSTARHGRLSAI
jgi:hypothetical protein